MKLLLDALAADRQLSVPPAIEGAKERLLCHGKSPVRVTTDAPAVNRKVCRRSISGKGFPESAATFAATRTTPLP
jgi:hypothetical protein